MAVQRDAIVVARPEREIVADGLAGTPKHLDR